MLSGSLYHHFPSKDAIATAIVNDFLADLIGRYRSVLPHVEGMRGELRALVYSSIDVAEKHPYATEIYQNENSFHGPDSPLAIADAVHVAHTFWLNAAHKGRDRGELRADLNPDEFARIVREGVWWSVRYHRESLAERGDELTDTLLAIFVDGAAAPAERLRHSPGDGITQRLDQIESTLEALARRLPD